MNIDFLIIGQGLAGSLLAWELIRRDCSVVIVDTGLENASQVAAGLINPVTGKRFVKANAVDTLLATARAVYRDLSDFFGRDFLIEKPMMRLLRTQADIDISRKRLKDPAYRHYLGEITKVDPLTFPVDSEMSMLVQKHTAYLLTQALLANLKSYFIHLNCYSQETLDYREIQLSPVLQWHELKPKRVVFCEGFKAASNPWFSNLPFRPAKGQILTLETDQTLPPCILNYGNWLVPLETGRFRIGATFERGVTDTTVTESAKRHLLQELGKINGCLAASGVVAQQANIRPCTQDRHPLIGHHPKHSALWIFNGFGAKGSLQIPWYSRHLAEVILNGAPLQSACNINRR